MSISPPAPATYPDDPRDWTGEDAARFWEVNARRTVRCRISGREGVFAAVLNRQAYVRFSNGLEFRTYCAYLEVLGADGGVAE